MKIKNLYHWLYLLLSAFITGFVSGIILVITDPAKFNLQGGLKLLLETSCVFGIFQAALFLKQSPLPKEDEEESISKVVTITLLFLCGIMATGCANVSYTEHKLTDGTIETHFRANSMFNNSQLSKLAVNRRNGEKSSQGLALGSLDNEVNTEAIKAVGDVGSALGEGLAKGLAKGAITAVK